MPGYASSGGASTTTTSGRIDRSARNRPRCSQRAPVSSKRAVSLRSIGSDPKNGFLKSLWRRDPDRARPSATPPNSPHDHSAMVTSCAIYDRHQHRDMFVLPHRRWLENGGTVNVKPRCWPKNPKTILWLSCFSGKRIFGFATFWILL